MIMYVVTAIVSLTSLLRFWILLDPVLGCEVRRKRILAGSILVVIPLLMRVLWGPMTSFFVTLVSLLMWSVVGFWAMKGRWQRRLAVVFLCSQLLDSAGDLVDLFIRTIVLFVTGEMRDYLPSYILNNLIVIGCLLLVALVRKRGKRRKTEDVPVIRAYVILCIIVFILRFVATSVGFFERFIGDPRVTIVADVVQIVALIALAVLIVIVFRISWMDETLKQMYEEQRLMKEVQQVYYETLLKKEEQTRAFRHDLANHLMCMEVLVQKGQSEELIQYLHNMTGQLHAIQKKMYATGDEIFDMMLNYYVNQAANVEVEVRGLLSQEIEVEQADRCTIYSNLLKNAAEELQQYEEVRPRLQILLDNKGDMARICIRNTSRPRLTDQKVLPTTKEDKKNHGIGLKNVRHAVDACGGLLDLGYADGWFEAVVYLPLKK